MGKRADIKPLPSVECLVAVLSYDPLSGEFIWKHTGKRAGTITERGYVSIKVGAKYYLAHRLAWKIMTGADPDDQVDHKDTNRANNRWLNLRPATNGQNIQNSKLRSDNVSGVKGVTWEGDRRKWRAVVTVNGKPKRLGRFDLLEHAEAVVVGARLAAHGDFARLA